MSLEFDFRVGQHDTCTEDDNNVEVHIAFVNSKTEFYANELLEGVIDNHDDNTFIDPTRAEHRKKAHDMLDAYLDACAKDGDCSE